MGLIGVLAFASPTIALLIQPPSGQRFSEIYVLDANHTLNDIPSDVESGVRYLIYLGLTNELGVSSYYRIYVKLGNQNDSLPDISLGKPSTLPVIYEYNLFLRDGDSWQAPFIFEIKKLSFSNGVSLLSEIAFNGLDYSVNEVSYWDKNKDGYFYSLIFEVWIYNNASNLLEYNNRFVYLTLNMTNNN